ncbi:hypothetical protein HK097_008076 [Rhizophlyctis rosea]|uniref:Uncharacterized protein n=1 Tax=Rhizophlyctis rosea TaxID=64517 RepID=A0AAD5X1W5_9FUNG|nr:hypothetical protein HK097_008076 [Rhizophlyctis rosea]
MKTVSILACLFAASAALPTYGAQGQVSVTYKVTVKKVEVPKITTPTIPQYGATATPTVPAVKKPAGRAVPIALPQIAGKKPAVPPVPTGKPYVPHVPKVPTLPTKIPHYGTHVTVTKALPTALPTHTPHLPQYLPHGVKDHVKKPKGLPTATPTVPKVFPTATPDLHYGATPALPTQTPTLPQFLPHGKKEHLKKIKEKHVKLPNGIKKEIKDAKKGAKKVAHPTPAPVERPENVKVPKVPKVAASVKATPTGVHAYAGRQ